MQNQAEKELERAFIQTVWEESQALGAERGAGLLHRSGLTPEDFTDATGRKVFGDLASALKAGRVPLLRHDDEAARAYLDTLEFRSANQLDAIADQLKAAVVRRALVNAGRQIYQLAQDMQSSPAELVAKAKALVAAVRQRAGQWEGLQPATGRVERHIREVQEGKKAGSVYTGFTAIDRATGGLPPTLVVVLAMPGVGKSAWVGSIIRNIAIRGERVALFSMEDAAEWLVFRFLAHESGVPQGVLRHKALTGPQWTLVGEGLQTLKGIENNVLVDERESLTPAEVLMASRDAINRGARAIFLDNMTAMRLPRGDRRDLEFQDFLVQARALANESGVPFVVISHAKRREGLDVDDIPLLTDAAESSAYEKLCRLAYGLCRDKEKNTITVAVLKNTNGKAWLKFNLELRPESALVEAEKARAWDYSREVQDGDGTL